MWKQHIYKHVSPPVGLGFIIRGAPVVVILVEWVKHIIQAVVRLLVALLVLLWLLALAIPLPWQAKFEIGPTLPLS